MIAAILVIGCATEPPPAPRAFLEGRVQSISRQDIREIVALAKERLAGSQRASHPIYCLYVENPNRVLVYHGEQRQRANDVEEYFFAERVHGRWQLADMEIVAGVNIPT